MRHTLIKLVLFSLSSNVFAQDNELTYLVLAETVAPLMLTTETNPMQGGIVTDTLTHVFAGTAYNVSPLVVPWQRTAVEMRERDNWIMYGMPSQCEQNDLCAASTEPIVEFDHVVVTLADTPIDFRHPQDLFGKRVLLVENFHYPGLDQYLATPVDSNGSGAIQDIRAFTPSGALRMLRHRRGDAYIDWRLRVLFNLQDADLSLEQVRLSDASTLIPTQNIHFFYSSKLSSKLRALIDTRLAHMRKTGVLQQIIQRYSGRQVTSFTK